eukprot:g13638.t1
MLSWFFGGEEEDPSEQEQMNLMLRKTGRFAPNSSRRQSAAEQGSPPASGSGSNGRPANKANKTNRNITCRDSQIERERDMVALRDELRAVAKEKRLSGSSRASHALNMMNTTANSNFLSMDFKPTSRNSSKTTATTMNGPSSQSSFGPPSASSSSGANGGAKLSAYAMGMGGLPDINDVDPNDEFRDALGTSSGSSRADNPDNSFSLDVPAGNVLAHRGSLQSQLLLNRSSNASAPMPTNVLNYNKDVHFVETKAVTPIGQQVERIQLEDLVKTFFPQSEFASFLGSALVRDPNFLDLYARKLPDVNVEALKEYISHYFDYISCEVKIPMIIDFLQVYVLDVRDRPDLLLKNLRSVINFEFLDIFHAAGPMLQKVFQQYGGNSARRNYAEATYTFENAYPEICTPLTAKLTVEAFDVTQLFAKFKSCLKPMSALAVRNVLKAAGILNHNQGSADEDDNVTAVGETVVMDLSAFQSPNGDALGDYAMGAVPSYNASIAVGERAVLVSSTISRKLLSKPVTAHDSAAGVHALRMDEFLEVESDTDDNQSSFPDIFLKIRRPDVYSKLEAERQLLYRVTEELPGARSYLLQSYIEKTILECDFEQEQIYLELGYEKYNGKANGRIFVPRVLARPLGDIMKNKKSSGYNNQNYNVGKASPVTTVLPGGLNDPGVLILEMAPGRPFDRLLAEQQGMPEKNQPIIMAVNTYLDCFDLWLAVALDKSQRHTFFHGDPHLGNLFWCDQSKRFSLIDFGNSYEIFGKDYPSGLSGCMYEFMQGGMLLKPERIFRVFPFREDVPESQREYLRNRVMNVAKQAFDDYFDEQLAKVGN